MKRIPAVLAAVVAMAFVATMAFAEDTTAPATTAPAKTAPAKTTSSTTHHHSSSSKSAHTPKTDLNTASKEDLMKLPGVDDATCDALAARIVAEARGGRTLAEIFNCPADYVQQLNQQGLFFQRVPPELSYWPPPVW